MVYDKNLVRVECPDADCYRNNNGYCSGFYATKMIKKDGQIICDSRQTT